MKVGRILAIVGGVLAIVSVFLSRISGTASINGLGANASSTMMDVGAGKIILVLGLIAIGLGALGLARGCRLWMGIVNIPLGVVILLLAFLVRQKDSNDLNAYRATFQRAGLHIGLGSGPLLALIAGLVVLVGGALMLKGDPKLNE